MEIRPAAENEVWEAFRWHEARDEGLGSEFIRASEACLLYIQENPTASAVVRLFYVLRDDVIFIIACFHASRNPKNLRGRLNGF